LTITALSAAQTNDKKQAIRLKKWKSKLKFFFFKDQDLVTYCYFFWCFPAMRNLIWHLNTSRNTQTASGWEVRMFPADERHWHGARSSRTPLGAFLLHIFQNIFLLVSIFSFSFGSFKCCPSSPWHFSV